MKRHELIFRPNARKAWNKLGNTLKQQLASKLEERLSSPRVEADRLREAPDCYKIKARSAGYRLVYRVYDDRVEVLVIAVGKRERGKVYEDMKRELRLLDG